MAEQLKGVGSIFGPPFEREQPRANSTGEDHVKVSHLVEKSPVGGGVTYLGDG